MRHVGLMVLIAARHLGLRYGHLLAALAELVTCGLPILPIGGTVPCMDKPDEHICRQQNWTHDFLSLC